MFGWKTYEYPISTDIAAYSQGDINSPRTYWWNHWFLVLTEAWKRTIVVEVDPAHADPHSIFTVGYYPQKGPAKCRPLGRMTAKVAFRVGFEPCYFFALNGDDEQIPLRVVEALKPAVMLDDDVVLV